MMLSFLLVKCFCLIFQYAMIVVAYINVYGFVCDNCKGKAYPKG